MIPSDHFVKFYNEICVVSAWPLPFAVPERKRDLAGLTLETLR